MLAPFVVNLLLSCLFCSCFWVDSRCHQWMDGFTQIGVRQCQRHKTAGTMGLLIPRAVSDSTRFNAVSAGMTRPRPTPMTRS